MPQLKFQVALGYQRRLPFTPCCCAPPSLRPGRELPGIDGNGYPVCPSIQGDSSPPSMAVASLHPEHVSFESKLFLSRSLSTAASPPPSSVPRQSLQVCAAGWRLFYRRSRTSGAKYGVGGGGHGGGRPVKRYVTRKTSDRQRLLQIR